MRAKTLVLGIVFSAFVLTLAQGCGSSGPENGKLVCGTGAKACPDNYECSKVTNTCWLHGTGPGAGGAPGVDGALSLDSGTLDGGKSSEAGPAVDAFSADVSVVDGGLPDSNAMDTNPMDAPSSQLDGPLVDAVDVPGADVPRDVAALDVPFIDVQAPDAPIDAPTICTGACCKDTDCPGPCQTCSSSHVCIAATGKDDPSGHCAGTCDATGACKSKPGQLCDTVAGGCASGSTCADGYCCDSACTGTCEACNVAGSLGKCTTLGANATPRAGHGACVVSSATCAGSCDGKSKDCAYPATVCTPASCTGTTYQPPVTCALGVCGAPVPQSCPTNQTCSGTACACLAPKLSCSGACIDPLSDALNCGSCGHNCQGGACIQGQCQPVVVVGSLGASGGGVFAVEGQYLYYNDFGPAVPGAPVSSNRILKTATNGTGSQIDDRQSAGVVGNLLISYRDRFGFSSVCNVSSCSTSRTDIPTGQGPVTLTSPASQYYATWSSDGSVLTINWYNASQTVATSYAENVASTSVDQNTMSYGNYVYWIRDLYEGVGDTYSSTVLFGVNASTLARAQLAGSMTTVGISIMDANAQSVLLSDLLGNKNLYRVPLPIGMGNGVPTLLVSSASALVGTEDANNIYWIDSGGTLYKCSAANCPGTKTIITNGQQVTGRLFQDATYLYWGTAGPSQIVRLAK